MLISLLIQAGKSLASSALESETLAADVKEAVSEDLQKIQPDVVADTIKRITPLALGFLYQLLIIVIIIVLGRNRSSSVRTASPPSSRTSRTG